MKGKLVVIPTPIGNLGDITLRAIDALRSVDLLLCEDSRVTGVLLKHLEIKVPLRSYHAHNEHRITDKIVDLIHAGNCIGLVSDAGTPALSDPGFLLLRALVKAKLHVEVLPGPTAVIPALLASGFPVDRFYFEGFLPHKKGRQSRWSFLASLPCTLVLYESPHRTIKCLTEVASNFDPNQQVAVCRELTKLHEEILHGTATELIDILGQRDRIKGEIVIVIQGKGGS